MCRSTTTNDADDIPSCLNIRAFCLRLYVADDSHGRGGGRRAVPETLTLAYLPRIDGGALQVNGSKVGDGAPAVVALHRVRSEEPGLLFASTDRVRLGGGERFVAYAGEEKVVRGVFRRRGGGGGGGPGWRMECRGCEEAVAAEVWVVGESGMVLRESAEIAAKAKEKEKWRGRGRGRRMGLGFRSKLEEIPEESDSWEGGADEQERGRSDSEVVVVGGLDDGWDRREEEEEEGMEGGDWGLEMERVRWAVDVGIWVLCLGVGLLVSRASSPTSLRRKRLF